MKQIVALFGEAEKGAYKKPHVVQKLPQLVDALGNPPAESEGLFLPYKQSSISARLFSFESLKRVLAS